MLGNQLMRYKSVVEVANLPPLLDGDGDSLDNDIVLYDEPQALVLIVTAQEYTNLLSVALNGAYTTFPDDYIAVIYPLIKAGKLSFCSQMLECLLNDPDVIAAVGNIAVSAVGSAGTPVTSNQENLSTPIVPDQVGECDLDVLWGYVTKMVDYIHQVNLDFLENLALLSELSDKVEAWIDAIPVFGAFVNVVVNTVTEVGDDLLASYEASWNDPLRDEIACELFCIAQAEGCTLSLLNIVEFILERYNLSEIGVGELPQTFELVQVLSYLGLVVAQGGGAVYSGDDMVYIMWLLQLAAVAVAEEFFSIETAAEYYIEALDSVPSGGWAAECDPCENDWEFTFDFTTGQHGFVAENAGQGIAAVYVEGQGWRANVTNAPTSNFCAIRRTFDLATLNGVSIHWSALMAGNRNQALLTVYEDSVAQITVQQTGLTAVLEYEAGFADTDGNEVRVGISEYTPGTAQNASIFITACTLAGTGFNPFV